MDDAALIAGKLTKAQREAIILLGDDWQAGPGLADKVLPELDGLRDLALVERERQLNALGEKCPAFARYIAEHEEPPVDPLLAEAEKLEGRYWSNDLETPHGLALAALRRGIEIAEERRTGE